MCILRKMEPSSLNLSVNMMLMIVWLLINSIEVSYYIKKKKTALSNISGGTFKGEKKVMQKVIFGALKLYKKFSTYPKISFVDGRICFSES